MKISRDWEATDAIRELDAAKLRTRLQARS